MSDENNQDILAADYDPAYAFSSLTIWTDAFSMQIRDDTVALHVMENARRSSEDGHPVLLTHAEARKMRDLLNMATAREML